MSNLLEFKGMSLICTDCPDIHLLPVERKSRAEELHVRGNLEAVPVVIKNPHPLESRLRSGFLRTHITIMILLVHSLDIMSDLSGRLSVNIVLMRSLAIEFKNGISARHGEIHSESREDRSLRQLARIDKFLPCRNCTVCVDVIDNLHDSSLSYRSVCNIDP